MDVDIVPLGAGTAGTLSSNKSNRTRSMRKRKFTTAELEAVQDVTIALESEWEGLFWFQKSTTRFHNGEKVHSGITRREHQLLKELVKSNFFTADKLRDVVVPLNDESSSTPRLRAFDWAVTNFAKGRPQLHIVGDTIVDPNLDYQNELKKHHRLLFDPFRRGTHLFFEVIREGEAETHRTTVGQLCFIKWCMEHGVDRYVEAHLKDIRLHMSASTKKTNHDKRRRELTSAPRKVIRGAVFDKMLIQ